MTGDRLPPALEPADHHRARLRLKQLQELLFLFRRKDAEQLDASFLKWSLDERANGIARRAHPWDLPLENTFNLAALIVSEFEVSGESFGELSRCLGHPEATTAAEAAAERRPGAGHLPIRHPDHIPSTGPRQRGVPRRPIRPIHPVNRCADESAGNCGSEERGNREPHRLAGNVRAIGHYGVTKPKALRSARSVVTLATHELAMSVVDVAPAAAASNCSRS